MQVDWTMVGTLLTAIALAAGLVMYVVRNETRTVKQVAVQEITSIKDLVALDRETVKLRLGKVEESLMKVETAVVAIADYKWQLKIMEERLLAQGARLDEMTRRFNLYLDSKGHKVEKLIDKQGSAA